MRLHVENEVTYKILCAAELYARQMTGKPVQMDVCTDGLRSLSHTCAWEVRLSLDTDKGQRTADGRGVSAGYDSHGWFLAAVFAIDPDAKIDSLYRGVEDFHRQTRDAFRGDGRDALAARLYGAASAALTARHPDC